MEITAVLLVSGKMIKEISWSLTTKGLVSQELEGYGASLTDYGTASEGIYGGRDGGFLLEYIPAGVTIGDQVDDQGQVVFKDTSDASKNRLWSGVGIASFGEQGSIYYHVGDE